MDERDRVRPPRSYHRSPADARRYQRHGVLYMGMIYAALGTAMGVVPLPVVAPVIVIAYLRGALLTHELIHVRRPEQVAWMLRMMMLFDTPLGLGYRENQSIHLRHHQQAATEADPEFYQIRGGPLRAFVAAMLGSELAAAKWVIARGMSPSLRREATVRALVMLTLVAAQPLVFLQYWIVIRTTIGVSNFMFHHLLHYRRGQYGTFCLRLPGPLDASLRLVLGRALAAVLCEHDAHHAWGQVKAERLPGLLQAYPAPSGGPR